MYTTAWAPQQAASASIHFHNDQLRRSAITSGAKSGLMSTVTVAVFVLACCTAQLNERYGPENISTKYRTPCRLPLRRVEASCTKKIPRHRRYCVDARATARSSARARFRCRSAMFGRVL